jgi:predicted exporter
MLTTPIARIVYLSSRYPWPVLGAFALLVLASGLYVARHFAINTDVAQLIDANAAWARRDAAVTAAFPNRGDATLVLVRAPAPEFAAQAARELATRLRDQPAQFRGVSLGAGDEFFRRNGLL